MTKEQQGGEGLSGTEKQAGRKTLGTKETKTRNPLTWKMWRTTGHAYTNRLGTTSTEGALSY